MAADPAVPGRTRIAFRQDPPGRPPDSAAPDERVRQLVFAARGAEWQMTLERGRDGAVVRVAIAPAANPYPARQLADFASACTAADAVNDLLREASAPAAAAVLQALLRAGGLRVRPDLAPFLQALAQALAEGA